MEIVVAVIVVIAVIAVINGVAIIIEAATAADREITASHDQRIKILDEHIARIKNLN